MTIRRVKVRARVTIGSLTVETPYVTSFNVSVNRNSPSTFSTVLKVHQNEIGSNITGTDITIAAGEDSPSNVIIVGIVKQAKLSPCFDDPAYVILSLQGSDVLSVLAGKKYTRRSRTTTSTFVKIDGVVRKGHKSGKFKPLSYTPGLNTENDVTSSDNNTVGFTDKGNSANPIKENQTDTGSTGVNITTGQQTSTESGGQ